MVANLSYQFGRGGGVVSVERESCATVNKLSEEAKRPFPSPQPLTRQRTAVAVMEEHSDKFAAFRTALRFSPASPAPWSRRAALRSQTFLPTLRPPWLEWDPSASVLSNAVEQDLEAGEEKRGQKPKLTWSTTFTIFKFLERCFRPKDKTGSIERTTTICTKKMKLSKENFVKKCHGVQTNALFNMKRNINDKKFYFKQRVLLLTKWKNCLSFAAYPCLPSAVLST